MHPAFWVFQVSGVSFQGVVIEWRELRTCGDLEGMEREGREKYNVSIFVPIEVACTCMQMVCCLAIKSMERRVECAWESPAARKKQNNT